MSDEHIPVSCERQDPLRARYEDHPEEAAITDWARTRGGSVADPFHGAVQVGSAEYGAWRFGIHRAVGGFHDMPNPGDILAAALASCLDSTIRVIANRIGVKLESLEVEVHAQADVRGTLLVDREVPVGFHNMRCAVRMNPAEGTEPDILKQLLSAAEHCCVVMRTLKSGVSIETDLSIGREQK